MEATDTYYQLWTTFQDGQLLALVLLQIHLPLLKVWKSGSPILASLGSSFATQFPTKSQENFDNGYKLIEYKYNRQILAVIS